MIEFQVGEAVSIKTNGFEEGKAYSLVMHRI
jgi:hypothetical protein